MLNNRTQTIQSITSTQSACSKSNNVRWLLCALLVTVYELISFVTLESQIQEYNKMMEIKVIYKRLLENVIFTNAKLASLYNAYWLMNTVTYHKGSC